MNHDDKDCHLELPKWQHFYRSVRLLLNISSFGALLHDLDSNFLRQGIHASLGHFIDQGSA